ncbi:DNA repair protein complementing XP-G cells [Bufo bufo]|uniref:DNA repair protein complementing XP-G cells n=1 Tax=Bufo bufo TaxID=8384 RepID=UPI001ABE82FE|nr:DNA repair protein complementing XP-G cells [Bufo bufo]
MGVQGLWKLLECSGRPVNPETLEGKILAVDISIWLNQAIKGARDRHGNALQNAHLLTLFHRLCKLLFFRIRPIFVFDGEAPLLKKQTLARRRQKKDTAASEAKRTHEKLLKTFLKRQAIKAALSGSKQRNEDFPSLPNVQRKEEEDIYTLPPLEENERNSSEEEEEKEWEERMTQKRMVQDEILANFNSVDIDSEEFTSLPAEVKHEILTDMKEFAKRRRTLYEVMPEDSNDFSQYQLKGLLKKNNLSRCLDNVRKEMNQQYTGEVRAQFETEGGFMKEVETRRLVSEDTSHYILIKGIKEKDKKDDVPEQAMPSSSSDMPKTYLDMKLASAHKPKKAKDSIPEERPPSPRTLFAIQEAMMESNSDEEPHNSGVTQSNEMASVGAIDGSVSPRTLQAIQEALTEDEMASSRKRPVGINDGKDELKIWQPKAKVLIISSSDEEDEDLVIESETKTALGIFKASNEVDCSTNSLTSSNDKSIVSSLVSVTNHGEIPHKVNVTKADEKDLNMQEKKTPLCSQDTPVEKPVLNISSQSNITPSLQSNLQDPSSSIATPISLELENSKLKLSEKTDDELNPSKNETDLQSSPSESSGSSSLSIQNNPVLVVPPQQKAIDTACRQEESTANVPDTNYVPMTPESIPIIDEVLDRDKEMDSGSEGSFIEVESDSDDSNSQQVQTTESPKDTMERQVGDFTKAASTSATQIEDAFREDERANVPNPELQQNEGEAKSNEWQDISMEELETLENNLFVQQTSLQAQRQQQERVAASVTGQMYLESQELLRLFGIPYIVAPMEAEAQCAILDLTDQTSGTITDDSDIWLFGARHVYKNFFSQNKYVEYFQLCDIQNQLGLDRSKLINLAYLMGSDYTDGISSVGYVSAMEILNEFSGHGLEPLIKFKEWWTEAQKNKKMRPNPHDTKVKKKLRDLELHPAFPNLAVADAYLKPVVDDSKGAFAWGRPDLDEIREFCESRFGWYRSKTDEVLLPVLKQLNTHQTQLRIDSFFRMENHEAHGLKSQRVRRAVTCMKRKEKDSDVLEVEEATVLMEKEYALGDKKNAKPKRNPQKGKKKKETKLDSPPSESPPSESVVGGFLGSGTKSLSPKNEKSFGDDLDRKTQKLNSCTDLCKGTKPSKPGNVGSGGKTETLETSSSSDDEDKVVQVAAKPVFQRNSKIPKTLRGRKK